MISCEAAMPVSTFCALTGIPRRTCQRKLARVRQVKIRAPLTNATAESSDGATSNACKAS